MCTCHVGSRYEDFFAAPEDCGTVTHREANLLYLPRELLTPCVVHKTKEPCGKIWVGGQEVHTRLVRVVVVLHQPPFQCMLHICTEVQTLIVAHKEQKAIDACARRTCVQEEGTEEVEVRAAGGR